MTDTQSPEGNGTAYRGPQGNFLPAFWNKQDTQDTQNKTPGQSHTLAGGFA